MNDWLIALSPERKASMSAFVTNAELLETVSSTLFRKGTGSEEESTISNASGDRNMSLLAAALSTSGLMRGKRGDKPINVHCPQVRL